MLEKPQYFQQIVRWIEQIRNLQVLTVLLTYQLIIEIKVIKLIFSFKKKYPNTAKKIVSVVIIKFVFATVVLYIANT